jgi:hypothetical protein
MSPEIWQAIDAFLFRWPDAKGGPVSGSEFEAKIGSSRPNIDPDYREFVLQFGGAMVGANPIFGLRSAKRMPSVGGCSTAPEITRWFQGKKWPGVDEWFVFSLEQEFNPIGFAPDNSVWVSDQMEFKQITKIAESFEDYLRRWCLMLKDAPGFR